MKQVARKLSMLALAAALITPVSLLAQEDKKDKEKETKEKKELEQYIITRKGDSKEKITIEINGDKITINGKPADESGEGDVTVKKMKLGDLTALRALRERPFNFQGDGMTFFNEDANRAMLGVTTNKTDGGVKVEEITKESAASKAGLKEGDVITKIDDKAIETPDDLSKAIRAHKPGDKVSVSYLRDNKEQKVTAELTKWKGVSSWSVGSDNNFKMDMAELEKVMPKIHNTPRTTPNGTFTWSGGSPKLGLSIQDTDDGKGVKVIEVDEESNAAKAGIKENDVITEVDGKAVNGADEMAKIIKESKEKNSVMIKLQRSGKTQNIEVKMPKKIKTADL